MMSLSRRHFIAASAASLAGGLLKPERAPAQGAGDQRTRVNQISLPIVAGAFGGTYLHAAADLSRSLNRPEALRVLPQLGAGSVQNVTDLLYLQGIDVTLVQADALAAMRDENLYPNLDRHIRFVTKLFNEEVHVLAGNTITSLKDLAGQRVNFDVGGSGTAVTATAIFSALGIPVEATLDDQPTALAKLRAGEITALVYVAGKPVDLFAEVPAGSGLRLIPVPRTPELLTNFLPAEFVAADYPQLIDAGPPLPTLAVGAAMIVYNWPTDTERYRRVARFVGIFLEHFDELLHPPAHPKWQEVTLSAALPGWTRHPAAEAWLAASSKSR
jgi:TRAP transporter TAXI family solute receptor